jgi:hypothetical protein
MAQCFWGFVSYFSLTENVGAKVSLSFIKKQYTLVVQNVFSGPSMVAHVCNLSFSGGRGRRIMAEGQPWQR